MKKKMGVWIDRKKAVIIAIDDSGEQVGQKTRTIWSGVERRVRPALGEKTKKPFGAREIVPDTRQDRRFAQQMERYYSQVGAAIRQAECIYIAGPGQAKIEFRKHIEKTSEIAKRIRRVVTVDKLTDRQFAAMVKDFFCEVQ